MACTFYLINKRINDRGPKFDQIGSLVSYDQEIYRPGTAISDASKLKSVYCSGRRSKQRNQGQRVIFAGGGGEYENIAIVGMSIMIYDYEYMNIKIL